MTGSGYLAGGGEIYRIISACGIISRCDGLNEPIISDGVYLLGIQKYLGLGSNSTVFDF